MPFDNRFDAGRRLATRLRDFADAHPIILGLPRGGVPVAFEVAAALRAPLDVIIVRKLGVPFQPELAMGAIGEDNVRIIDDRIMRMTGVLPSELEWVERKERIELERRGQRFRSVRSRLPLTGRTVIVVDDGVATGSTARAACRIARAQGAARVVFAVPAGPVGAAGRVGPDADEVICLEEIADFFAVGQAYQDFTQISDDEVIDLLVRASAASYAAELRPATTAEDPEVSVPIGAAGVLQGMLSLPQGASEVVVFAHGSGSSRFSPRNRYVAAVLDARGIGTLLIDLLTADEEQDRRLVFDIDLLASRLTDTTNWLRGQPETAGLGIGLFGASTGAAAALVAAAAPDAKIASIVSRGGRPDLAGAHLEAVRAPTLLIVGGADEEVLELNREAQSRMRCVTRLEIIPGATHLFEEAGALETVAALAGNWFSEHRLARSA